MKTGSCYVCERDILNCNGLCCCRDITEMKKHIRMLCERCGNHMHPSYHPIYLYGPYDKDTNPHPEPFGW